MIFTFQSACGTVTHFYRFSFSELIVVAKLVMAEKSQDVDVPSTSDADRDEREAANIIGVVEIKMEPIDENESEQKDDEIVIVDDLSSDGGVPLNVGSHSTESMSSSSPEESLCESPRPLAEEVRKYFELFGQGRAEDVENHIKNTKKTDLDSKISSLCAKMANDLSSKRKIVEISSSPVRVVKEKKFVVVRSQSFFYHNK